MSTTTAEVLLRPASEELRFLPEGPYPVRPGVISWVAIQHGPEGRAGSLNLLDLKTRENESYKLPGRPGFAFPCSDGKSFVVGCERSLGIFEPTSGSWRVLCDGIDAQVTGTIINDAVVFEDYLIFGCKDLKFQEAKAGLYLWDARRNRLTQLRNDQTCSNGKSVRRLPNGDCELIDIDTPTRQVAAYTIDFERGELGPRRVVLDLTKAVGFPDGAILTPDERSIIISFYNPDPPQLVKRGCTICRREPCSILG